MPEIITAALSTSVEKPESSALPTDIQYMPPGVHEIHAKRNGNPVTLHVSVNAKTADVLNEFLSDNLAKAKAGTADRPYFDFNHEDREAAAWPLEFFWAGNDPQSGGVRCRLEWSAKGNAAITGKTFRRFSPSFIPDDSGNVVSSDTNMGGLVNRAAFRAIQPLFAKETKDRTQLPTLLNQLRRSGLIPDATAEISTVLVKLNESLSGLLVQTNNTDAQACDLYSDMIDTALGKIDAEWSDEARAASMASRREAGFPGLREGRENRDGIPGTDKVSYEDIDPEKPIKDYTREEYQARLEHFRKKYSPKNKSGSNNKPNGSDNKKYPNAFADSSGGGPNTELRDRLNKIKEIARDPDQELTPDLFNLLFAPEEEFNRAFDLITSAFSPEAREASMAARRAAGWPGLSQRWTRKGPMGDTELKSIVGYMSQAQNEDQRLLQNAEELSMMLQTGEVSPEVLDGFDIRDLRFMFDVRSSFDASPRDEVRGPSSDKAEYEGDELNTERRSASDEISLPLNLDVSEEARASRLAEIAESLDISAQIAGLPKSDGVDLEGFSGVQTYDPEFPTPDLTLDDSDVAGAIADILETIEDRPLLPSILEPHLGTGIDKFGEWRSIPARQSPRETVPYLRNKERNFEKNLSARDILRRAEEQGLYVPEPYQR